jgi:hypothetical protein
MQQGMPAAHMLRLLLNHPSVLRTIVADVGHLPRDDQMTLVVHGSL